MLLPEKPAALLSFGTVQCSEWLSKSPADLPLAGIVFRGFDKRCHRPAMPGFLCPVYTPGKVAEQCLFYLSKMSVPAVCPPSLQDCRLRKYRFRQKAQWCVALSWCCKRYCCNRYKPKGL